MSSYPTIVVQSDTLSHLSKSNPSSVQCTFFTTNSVLDGLFHSIHFSLTPSRKISHVVYLGLYSYSSQRESFDFLHVIPTSYLSSSRTPFSTTSLLSVLSLVPKDSSQYLQPETPEIKPIMESNLVSSRLEKIKPITESNLVVSRLEKIFPGLPKTVLIIRDGHIMSS